MKVDFIEGMNLGLGYNSASNIVHPVPAFVNVGNTYSVSMAQGQEVYMRIELLSNTLSLAEQMGVSASASLSYALTNKGSAKAFFSQSSKQNNYSIYVLVQIYVTNNTTLLDLTKNYELKPEAKKLLPQNQPEFIQQYGESFVSGIITGGEFIGILEIKSESDQEFQEIKTKLKGSGNWGAYDIKGSATFEKKLEEVTSEYSLTTTVLKRGGTGPFLENLTRESFIKEALEFPEKVKGDNAYPYAALLTSFNNIPREIPFYLDITNQTSTLDRLGKWRQQLLNLLNDMEYARENPREFPGINLDLVSKHYFKISEEITKIVESGRKCYLNYQQCDMPVLDFTLMEFTLPPRTEEGEEKGVEGMFKSVRINVDNASSSGRNLDFFVSTGSLQHPIVCLADNNGYPHIRDLYARPIEHNGKQGVHVTVICEDNADGNGLALNLAQPDMIGDYTVIPLV